MQKIIIETEELPSLKESKAFFREVAEAYSKDCSKATFEWYTGLETITVKVTVE